MFPQNVSSPQRSFLLMHSHTRTAKNRLCSRESHFCDLLERGDRSGQVVGELSSIGTAFWFILWQTRYEEFLRVRQRMSATMAACLCLLYYMFFCQTTAVCKVLRDPPVPPKHVPTIYLSFKILFWVGGWGGWWFRSSVLLGCSTLHTRFGYVWVLDCCCMQKR